MLSNEQKAARLEEIADNRQARAEEWLVGIACEVALADAALLRESAAMWRERDGVRWEDFEGGEICMAVYKGMLLRVDRSSVPSRWSAYDCVLGRSADVAAAQAAAVAWVDGQEGQP